MRTLLNKIWIIIIPIMLVNFAHASSIRAISKKCPKSTKKHPVSYMFVVLDKEKRGLPKDVIMPFEEVDYVDFKNPKIRFTSILKKGHEIRQEEVACWRAVVKDPQSATGYKLTRQKIAVLWRPNQKIKFGYAIREKIPSKNPIDIAYKYTIATKASDPKKGETYLDPRMVVRIRR